MEDFDENATNSNVEGGKKKQHRNEEDDEEEGHGGHR